ncbi:MAG: hypothetical protein U0L85_03465 [Bacilli bacterium]|nr:hypothetical protein [Bacilli bacterium]
MILELLLKDREKWQFNTIEKLKKDLLIKPEEELNTHINQEEKLVSIYGFPQVGKTTLILSLLGIKKDYQKEVYDILRADVEKGNSSTSTAIIYQKSENDLFALQLKKNITSLNNEKEFHDQKSFIKKLKEVRSNVEKNQQSEDILFIYLPKKYFDDSKKDFSNINILDLPGDHSKNLKERAHVNSILNKYLSMTTINIIACKSDDIQSLEEVEILGSEDWKYLPQRYCIVITNSFSSLKNYFKKSCKTDDFLNFIKNSYTDAMNNVFDKNCKLELFPIELGESLESLVSSLNSRRDKEIIIESVEIMIHEILEYIQNHHGNSLKTMVEELVLSCNKKEQKLITQIDKQISDAMIDQKKLEEDISNIERKIDFLNGLKEESEIELRSFQDIVSQDINFSFLEEKISFIKEFKQKYSIYKKYTAEKISDKLKNLIKDSLNKKLKEHKELHEENDIFLYIDMDKILREVLDNNIFLYGLEEIIEKKSFFSIFKKDKINSYEVCLKKLFELFESQINSMFLIEKNKLLEKFKKLSDNQRYTIDTLNKLNKLLDKKQNELQNLKDLLVSNVEYKKTIKNNLKNDKDYLENYKIVAQNEFSKQKKEIWKKINSSKIESEDKIQYLIFLGLLEKDYNNIMNINT